MNPVEPHVLPDSDESVRADAADEALARAASAIERRTSTSRSIARLSEPSPLSSQALEARRVIHSHPSARHQADAFREVRTRLLAMGGDRNFVTMVVGVSPQCGGSFVARNLAAAFAFDDTKTALLVDCNLRHPSQQETLGVSAEHGGLTDYLEHPSIGIPRVLLPTGIPRLRLIPAGTQRESGQEYFSSFRMRALVDSLRCRYPDRYLFIDAPAVRGSPDARMLADLADFVVLVVGHARNGAQEISRAASAFSSAKLAGIVFNEGS